MNTRYSAFQKLLALALTLVLVIGLLPNVQLPASAAIQAADRVADPSTLNEWEDYFGPNVLSTEFAGGVWTDKSVFTNADAFQAEITMDDPNNNFLIALSAIAANQQVVGYTSTPMDVMLVLDVSGSMDSGSKDSSMIAAANQAIGSLLSQNNNNRIGVVLYSGNSNTNQNAGTGTATVILPLDHYTTTSTTTIGSGDNRQTIPAYLSLSGNSVSVSSGVLNSDKEYPDTGSKSVTGGTYIQNGLYKAWGEFSQVTDTKVPAGNAQAGTQRTPIMILMSDGQPTLATADYNSVGTSNRTYGDGSEDSTSWQTVFLTQLTASWVKGKMEAHYGTTAKFYTLGLGTGNSNYATAVLNPSNSYTTLNTYWNRFFNNTANNSGNVNVGGNGNSSWYLYKDSNVKVSDYVDNYYLAANASDLLAAFGSIVEDIELDAAGHVTLVEPIGEDMSGYITFTDELGAMMEVKDLKGLVLGTQLFTGHELAKSLQDGSMGTLQNPTEYGDEFIATVRERLGIDSVTDAQALVMAAYADGQLAYDDKGTANEADDSYSNYIGWYSNDAGDYLGFWDKDTGITADGAPAGATWINKSYGYLGTAGSSDMMHVVVMISTHITSGMQVVQYKIPASLIPKVTYSVELDGSDPTQMKSITRKGADPLRLVYEVGLRSDLNAVNLEQAVENLPEGVHVHKNDDGTYSFYTNLWGNEDGSHEIDYSDPLGHQVAQSHFDPAVGNDRYYYTEDTPVYVKSGSSYSLYTGTAAPSGDGYYRAYHYYTASGYTTEYLPMSTYALNMAAANGRADDGYWYIPEGSIFQQIDRFQMKKSLNLTQTLEYYDYPVVVKVDDHFDVYAFLGNNGKITVAPAQGIKLTKTVTEAAAGAPDTFTFNVTLSQAVANPNVTDPDGNAYTGNWSVSGNVITVELKAGETVYITDLPTGVSYSVAEEESRYYTASSSNATGTVAANTINAVDFVNAPKGYGDLIISKDVDHPYTTVPQALTDKEFTINVTLSGPNTAGKTFAVTGSETISSVTTDANGSFSVVLKDNGSLTVVDLPEDTTFVTTEALDPTIHKGFSMDADRSTLSGTIVKDSTVQTHVVNVYAPSSPVAAIDVTGTKTLVDEAGAFNWEDKSFTIRLEQYHPETGTYTTIGETTVSKDDLTFKFEDMLTFNAIGTYYYKVSEVIPAERLEGMSYDTTVGRFEVRVTDNDVNGELEFDIFNVDTGEQISGSDYVYTFTKDFVNTHTTDATYVEFVVNKDIVDPHSTGVSEAGFLFELFAVEDGVTAATPTYSMRTVLVDGQGQALFHIPITKTGTQTYILKEIEPDDADKISGMTYDTTEYTVIITTTADDDGKLVPSVSFQKNGTDVAEEALVFTNAIDLQPLTLHPYITKVLEGREPLSDTEFTFQIMETDGSFVTPKAGGYSDTVSVGEGDAYYTPITITTVGTYYFRSWEVAGDTKGMTYDNAIYHITVNVTANADGELVKDVSYVRVGTGLLGDQTSAADSVKFTNTYVNNDTAEVVLSGSKSLTGRNLITGEFRFKLEGPNGYTETVSNRANGSFVFSPITYTAADIGTHTYTITELNDGKSGVQYDGKTHTVTVTVSDNGAGELTVTTTGADSILFNNTYSTSSTTVSFSGTKTWLNTDLNTAKPMEGGEFTFELYASNKDFSTETYLVADTTNNANGSFGFSLHYTEAGEYYYLLREKIGDEAGVGYDASVYQIKISVYDTGLGTLTGHVAQISKIGTGSSTLAFGNYYTPASTEITIEGEKELSNRPLLDGEFDYELYAANASFTASGEALQSVTNENGRFAFAPISFTNSGTYYYVVKEVVPSAAVNNIYDGVIYDTSVFGITVTVTDNGQGALEASYTVTKNGAAAALKFQNVYTITNYASFSVSGTKTWFDTTLNAAKPMTGGEFTFELYDAHNVRIATAHNDANGTFTFHDIPVTSAGEHTFTIKELDSGLGGITYDDRIYTVTVWASDNRQGDLVIEGTPVIKLDGTAAELKFENTYKTAQTTAQFRAQKVLEGKDLAAGQFSFSLFDSEGELLQTKKNLAGGGILFDEISYTVPGDYTYTIREVVPLDAVNNVKDGTTYDTHVCEVTVSVGDNGDGTLTADVSYVTLPQFTNVYTVAGDTTVDISGKKVLIGKDLEEGLYSFTLYKGDQELATVTNAADGSFLFDDVALDSLGTHTFTVKEVKGDLPGISYDSNVYTVTVTVTDDGYGGMQAGAPVVTRHNVVTDLIFTNRYINSGTGLVSVGGSKLFTQNGTAKPIGEKQFSFLLSGPNHYTETVYANADGSFAFTDLAYDKDDIGHTYTYTVQEVIPQDADSSNTKDGITYDPTVFIFTVSVADDNRGGITITKKLGSNEITDDIQVQFSNAYTVQGTGSVAIGGTKTYTDSRTQSAKKLEAGMFSFNLKGHGIDETVTNAEDGSFAFSPITYTKDHIADTPYIYTVSEVKGDKDHIGYDETLFTVEVMVEDDGTGGLNVSKTVKKNGIPVGIITFANTYNIVSGGTVAINGVKSYTKDLAGDDFSFILSQLLTDGTKQLEEVKNAADGTFSFTDLTYTKDDIGQTYTYTVQEAIPADAVKQADGTYLKDGIIYDPDVYTITVSIADNGEGGLEITKTMGVTEIDEIKVEFDNAYDITGTGKLELTGTKELTGGKPMADGDFSFGLYDAEGNLVVDPVTNKDGKFTFTVVYDKNSMSAEPIVYTVKEIIPSDADQNADGTYTLNGITYDATVYTVKVTLSDNGIGGIDAAYELVDAEAIAFENVYTPANHVVYLNVQKNVVNKAEDGISAEGFQFELYYQDLLLATYSSNAEGKASFPVAFTAKDIGQTYTFQIQEINTHQTGVTYDTTVHEITVKVEQNEDGTIKSTVNDVLTDTITVAFTNTYEKPTTPVTGDSTDLAMLFVLLLISGTGLATVFAGRKKKEQKANR